MIGFCSCPKCGKENSAYESEEGIRFCGECEEKYQKDIDDQISFYQKQIETSQYEPGCTWLSCKVRIAELQGNEGEVSRLVNGDWGD